MAKPKTQEPVLTPDAHNWFDVRGAYRFAIRSAMDGTAVPNTPGAAGIHTGLSALGIQLRDFTSAFGTTTPEGAHGCQPQSVYTCNYINEGFTTVDEFDPERQPGAWPPSTALYQQIGQAFTDKKPASATIPLQLQANTLESYRRQLLHKKWRRCHHLNAVNASLVAEPRNQDEIERLLLGQQVGNTGPVVA